MTEECKKKEILKRITNKVNKGENEILQSSNKLHEMFIWRFGYILNTD